MRALAPGAIFAGRYRIETLVGRGGMGSVYRAIDERSGEPRALKVLRPKLLERPEMRARFATETRITSHVDSQHIARVHDAGVDDERDQPFMALELLTGRELSDEIAEGPIAWPRARAIVEQTAEALAAAHARGVVHRDLKPENLFVEERDGGPWVKLLDFGIAKLLDSLDLKQTTGLIGTPVYMAPEQIHREAPLSGRTDLYALAQILFEMLSGEPYWAHERRTAGGLYRLFVRIMDGTPEPASQRSTLPLPEGFDAWFARATRPSPDERFTTAAEMVSALGSAL